MSLLADIVVRAKDGHEMTVACLRSIAENTPGDQYRLILVDDGSDPPLLGVLTERDLKPGYYVRHGEAKGSVTAINSGLGIALAKDEPEWVVLLDNDTEVPAGDRDWLERFVAEAAEFDDTAVAGATGWRVNPPQQILSAPNTFMRNCESGPQANPELPTFVSFACILRKAALRECGLWDERYDPGQFEDTDYGLMMRFAGWKLRVARSVYIHHKCHQTFQDKTNGLLARNRTKFVQKWGLGRLFDDGFVPPQEMLKALQHAANAAGGEK